MRRCVPFALLILLILTVASTPSYWFSQLQVKPDAQQAQEFWFVPGTGISFTYQTNHVIINNSGTNIATATNALNWSGSNAMNTLILSTSNTLNNTVLSSSNVLNNTILSSSNVLNNTILSSSNTLNNTILSSSNVLNLIATTNAWHLNGNTLGQSNSFLGTIDRQPIRLKVENKLVALFDTNNSISLLNGANAPAVDSIAAGPGSLSSAVNTVAIGTTAHATTLGATAIGSTATASGQNSVAVGLGATATGVESVALGNSQANGVGAFASGHLCQAAGDFSVALGNGAQSVGRMSVCFADGNSVNNDTSMVLDLGGSLTGDTGPGQFVATFGGGYWFYSSPGDSHFDANVHVANDVRVAHDAGIQNITRSTNGYYYVATNNGIAAALSGLTPLHAWATLSGWSAAASPLINPGATTINTYYPITNYARIVTNLWRAFLTKTNGVLQNDLPGWYKISFSVSARATANEQLEVDVVTNGVNTDYISAHGSVGTGGNDTCMSGVGRLWIPANTKVSLSMQNSTAGHTMTISHVQLDVGP